MKKTKKPVTKKTKKKKKTEEDSLREIKVGIVGIGGGGGSIISGISHNLKKIFFTAVNTDKYALEEVTKKKKIKGIVFGKRLTDGLGTGMNPKLGKQAAEEDIEEVKKIFTNLDIVIFTASLGGGTGGGALSVFAAAAKEMGCLVYGVFTLPFSFEGEKKTRAAKDAVREASPYLHAVTIMPNEKIFEVVDKNTPLKEALMVINKNLASSLEGLVETIYETGLINIDFADVRTILDNKRSSRKLAYLSTVEGNLEEGAEEIVRRAVSNSLYPYAIKKVRGILVNITGGKDIGLTDIAAISENIGQYTEDDAKIIIGIMQKNKYKDKVRITLLATGCETDFLKKELEKDCSDDMPDVRTNEVKKKNGARKEEKKKSEEKKRNDKAGQVTIMPGKKETIYSVEEERKTPESEEEKDILEQEKKWEKPSFLRRIT